MGNINKVNFIKKQKMTVQNSESAAEHIPCGGFLRIDQIRIPSGKLQLVYR
jgi:hypothetical protein